MSYLFVLIHSYKKKNYFFLILFQCRLIVAQMSDTRAPAWNHLLWPIVFTAIISAIPWHQYGLIRLTLDMERIWIYLLTVVATITHFHYGVGVVCEMCDHFKIRCFKVRLQKSE